MIRPHVARFPRRRWRTPDGETAVAPLPGGVDGHFGPELRRFALARYHHGQVAAARLVTLRQGLDAIGDGVRGRARGFIETTPEAQRSGALSRRRCGRRRPGEDEAAPSVVGARHRRRAPTLTGAFGQTRIAAPRARSTGEDGKTREGRSGSPAGRPS